MTRSALRAAATEALEIISGRDCSALDIGCSDGSLLSYYPRWVERCGIDRSPVVEEVGEWAWTARGAFPSADVDAALGQKKFDIVTAISILEEIDEPRAFLARIKQLLSDDGVLVLETVYAPMTLTRAGAEIFANGARSIYSLGVLERLLRDCDLKIFRGLLTDKDGGSIRLFITHATVEEYDFDPWYERLATLWDEENALALRTAAPYQAFEARLAKAREGFAAEMKAARRDGRSVHLFGADGAAALYYRWAGEGAEAIDCAIGDPRRDDREALFPGGPHIVSETQSRAMEPDLLIAPAATLREALELFREQILKGMTVLTPTPTPRIVHAGNYAAEYGKTLAGADGAGGPETLRAILGAAGGLQVVSDRDRAAG